MKREKNISRRVALNLWLPIIVVVFILVAALGVIEVNPGLGYTILVGDVIYLIAAVLCYEYTEKMISKEFLAAGFEQSQIQKQILKELPVPYVMTDQDGTIIWHNEQFSEIVGQKITKKSITQIFPGLYKKVFPQNGQMKEYCITHEEHKYHVECRNMVFKNLEQTEGEIQEDKETQGDILQVFYFFDETQLIGYKEESRKKSLVAGLIYIDNYEEVLENMEEVRQSLLLALVERKIMKYMQGLDAIIKGFEKDKFLFVFEEEKLENIGKTMNLNVNTVKSRLYRAMDKLKKYMVFAGIGGLGAISMIFLFFLLSGNARPKMLSGAFCGIVCAVFGAGSYYLYYWYS